MTVTTELLLNLGCGLYPMRNDGWVNIDADPATRPDVCALMPPIPYPDGAAQEIWACHFLEHLSPPDAAALLAECYRVLQPGGWLGIVVPDTRAIMQRWLAADPTAVEIAGRLWQVADLDDVAAVFLYSTIQETPHRWSYDATTLRRAIERAGFQVTGEIDRFADPRLGTGQWYQCGWAAVRP